MLLFQIWPEPDLGTLIQPEPEPEPDLAETCFWVTEQCASDKTNGVNSDISCYRGSAVQCILCCVTFASL